MLKSVHSFWSITAGHQDSIFGQEVSWLVRKMIPNLLLQHYGFEAVGHPPKRSGTILKRKRNKGRPDQLKSQKT